MRKGAAWNDADQLLPVEQEESVLEMALDEVPPGIITAPGVVAFSIMLLMAALAEFTLLRAGGFAGPAVFFPCAALLIFFGIPERSCGPRTIILTAMLLGVSYRLAVYGNLLLLVAAVWLLSGLTLSFRHQSPFFLRTIVFAIESLWGGYEFFLALHARMTRALVLPDEDRTPSAVFNIGLPLTVLAAFGGVALALRPDLLQTLTRYLGTAGSGAASAWTTINNVDLAHLGVTCLVMWITAGLLRPVLNLAVETPAKIDPDDVGYYFAPLFIPLRNTLFAVIVPFAILLLFEIQKQSSQVYSAGFEFEVYCQNGVKWLAIISLGTSALMCMIFNGATLADSRLPVLRVLSYALVGLNFVQAGCAIQRYNAYIQFNGMDQAKTAGMLACGVLASALLVTAYMSIHQQNVLWLLRRQTLLVAAAAYLWLVLPVDRMVQSYNVQAILNGNPAPVVQIAKGDFAEDSVPVLLPLCEVSDPVIREGALAIIANRFHELEAAIAVRADIDWTSKQLGTRKTYADLQRFSESHNLAASSTIQQQAKDRLRKYAEQWQ